MKQILSFLLALSLLFSFASCTSDLEDIAKYDFAIDKGTAISDYDCALGFSDLQSKLDELYAANDNIIEQGKPVDEAVVEFDDALLLRGDEYDFPLRMYYYIMVEIKSSGFEGSEYYGSDEKLAKIFWDSLFPDLTITRKQKTLDFGLDFCYDILAIMHAVDDFEDFEFVDNSLDSYNNMIANFGSVEALDEYLEAYGMNCDYLKVYYEYLYTYSQFKEYLAGADGVLFPTEEEQYSYFETDCAYLQQIVFTYAKTDTDGCIKYKSDEEIQQLREQGQALYAEIVDAPEKFERNMHLTQHEYWTENAAGYVYVPGEVQDEIFSAYKTLLPGEITAIDTPIGYYIIKAIDKNENVFFSAEERILDSLLDKRFKEVMQPYYDAIILDEEQHNRYKFEEIITF